MSEFDEMSDDVKELNAQLGEEPEEPAGGPGESQEPSPTPAAPPQAAPPQAPPAPAAAPWQGHPNEALIQHLPLNLVLSSRSDTLGAGRGMAIHRPASRALLSRPPNPRLSMLPEEFKKKWIEWLDAKGMGPNSPPVPPAPEGGAEGQQPAPGAEPAQEGAAQ